MCVVGMPTVPSHQVICQYLENMWHIRKSIGYYHAIYKLLNLISARSLKFHFYLRQCNNVVFYYKYVYIDKQLI